MSSSGANASRSGSRSADRRSSKPAISSSTDAGSHDHGQGGPGVIEPARRHRRDRRREHAALGLGGRPPDPLGHQRAAPPPTPPPPRRAAATLPRSFSFERCVSGSKSRSDAIVSPSSSTRTARSRSGGKTSKRPPRTARSPVSIDEIAAVIPEPRQPPDHGRAARSRIPCDRCRNSSSKRAGVRQPHEERARRQDRGPVAGAAPQRRQQRELVAPRLQRRGDALVRRERRRRRVEDALHPARREVAEQPLGLLLVGDHDRQRPLEIARERREQHRGQRADAARHDQAVFSPADPAEQVRVGGKAAGEIREHRVMPGRGVYRTRASAWSFPSSQSMHARCCWSWLAR